MSGWQDSGGFAAFSVGNGDLRENTVSDHCFWNDYLGNSDADASKLQSRILGEK